MSFRKMFIALVLICVLTGIAGCAKSETAAPAVPSPAAVTAAPSITTAPGAAASAPATTRTITDTIGRKVVIPAEVKKVVVIKGACMVPGILSALGRGDTLISGLCFKGGSEDIQLKVQPGYARLDVIAPTDAGVDIEELAKLKPDVVVVWTNVKNVDKIAEAGIPVLVADISTWDNVRSVFTLLGDVLNAGDQAKKIVDVMNKTADLIKNKTASIPQDKKKKILLVSDAKTLTVLGGTSHNNFMIEMTGGISAMKDVPGHFVQVDMETIVKSDPDIIVVSASSKASMDIIQNSKEWQNLRAVKNNNLYLAPRGVFFWDKPSAETPLFLLWQTYIQYPDLVTKEDLLKETKTFFKDFFHYELTEEDLKSIFPRL